MRYKDCDYGRDFMKIKKICAALALGGLVLALTACGNSGSSSSKAASAVQPTSQNGKYVPNPTGKPMSEDLKDQLESLHEKEAKSIDTIKELPAGSNKGKKIMIAYFTWGGITGEVAHSIQQKIGGDIYEIKRDPDYSKEYNAVLKEAAAETDSNARPKLAGTQPDLKQYDVLVLGYSAWWFTAPMVIPSFLEQQDLKGKLIVPFMCSYSSPIEVNIPAIAAAAPGAKIFQGLTLDANTSDNVIDPWLTKAGLM